MPILKVPSDMLSIGEFPVVNGLVEIPPGVDIAPMLDHGLVQVEEGKVSKEDLAALRKAATDKQAKADAAARTKAEPEKPPEPPKGETKPEPAKAPEHKDEPAKAEQHKSADSKPEPPKPDVKK